MISDTNDLANNYRTESSCNGSDVGHADLQATPSASASPPRRASTSVVQKSESCQAGDYMLNTTKAGSLPTITLADSIDSNIRYPSFNALETSNMTLPTPTLTPFPGWVPWWSDPAPLLSRSDAQHNWVPIPIGGLKRKREWHHERSSACPAQEPLPLQSLPSLSNALLETSDIDAFGEIDLDNTGFWSNANMQGPLAPLSSQPTTVPSVDSDLNASNSSGSFQDVASTADQTTKDSQLWPTQPGPPQATSMRQSTLLQPYNNNWQRILVPASLVPDQSVSPRTKTVEVLKQPNSDQASLRLSTQGIRPMPAPSQYQLTRPMGMSIFGRASRKPPQVQHQQISPPSSIPNPATIRHPQPETNPLDILRKPSLYKIPPWPSTTSPSVNISATPPNGHIGASRTVNRASKGGIHYPMVVKESTAALNQESPILAKNPRDRGGTVTAVTPPSEPRTQPFQSTVTSGLVSRQGKQTSRRHPPNL